MEIVPLKFEKKEIEINETYIDEDGKIKERKRKILVPTGKCIEEKSTDDNKSKTVSDN